MQESITIEIVKDPAVTALIRELKARLKDYAIIVRGDKTAYKDQRRAWDKLHRDERVGVKMYPPNHPVDHSVTITALFIIYGQLRNTKHPHLNMDAMKKYFTGTTYSHIKRRNEYNKQIQLWNSEHPNCVLKSALVNM